MTRRADSFENCPPVKVALKLCGGCNPDYDRTEYWERIEKAAGRRIEWRRPDDDGFAAVLIINGCQTACPEKEIAGMTGCDVLSVRNNELEPERLIEKLLHRGAPNDQN